MRTWQKVLVGAAAFLIIIWVIAAVTLWSNSGDQLSGFFPQHKLGPKAKRAMEVVRAQKDQQEGEEILNRGFAEPVSCAVAVENRVVPVLAEEEATPRIRVYTYTWPNGIVECYLAPGGTQKLFHRITGKQLEPMSDAQAVAIIDPANAEKYGSSSPGTFWAPPSRHAVTAHRPAPQPTATPLPELGQGPCCK